MSLWNGVEFVSRVLTDLRVLNTFEVIIIDWNMSWSTTAKTHTYLTFQSSSTTSFMARTQIISSWHLSAWLNQPHKTVNLEKNLLIVAMGYGIKNVWIHFTAKELVRRTIKTMETYNYYHFIGHCGAFFGLKWRIWRTKMYFSPLK